MKQDRKLLVDAFGSYLTENITEMALESANVWTCKVGNGKKLYVTLDCPNPYRNGEIISIYYGLIDENNKVITQTYYKGQKQVSFPYKLHKELFVLFEKPFNREVSFIRWFSTAYRKDMLYGNSGMTKYSISYLVPCAVEQIGKYYKKIS